MEAKLDMVLEQVGRDKNIDKSVLIGALEQAILTAAKRTFGMNREMEAKYNPETGSVDLFLIVNVVEEDDAIEGREITVAQAHTAGPLGLVRDQCVLPPGEPLLAMNGDILTDLDMHALLEFHREGGYELTIATRTFRLQHPYGVIRTDGDRIVEIVEKPIETDTVSAGIYVITPEALARVPAGRFFDMPDLVNACIAAGSAVGSFLFVGEWLSIDRPEQLEDAGRILAERHA